MDDSLAVADKKEHESLNQEPDYSGGEQFSVQMMCFSSIGFNREGHRKYPKTFTVLHLVDFLLLFMAFSAEFSYMVTNFDDVLLVAECCAPLSTEIIVITKLLTYMVYEKRFYELMDRLKALSDCNSPVTQRAQKLEKAATITYLTSANMSGGILVVSPIIIDLVSYYFFGVHPRSEMPYKTVFPYATNVSPAYEVTYFLLVLATHVTVIQSVALDSLFFGFCVHICANFELLRESFNGDKRKFTERHEEILQAAKSVNKLFTAVIIVQFLMSSTLLCVLGFQLVAQKSVLKRIVATSFGTSIIIQFFIYCYGGQIMRDKSSEVADLLYENDKDLVVVIARAQRAAKIKVGFFDACLPTFNAVLSSAASLITLLKSFLD